MENIYNATVASLKRALRAVFDLPKFQLRACEFYVSFEFDFPPNGSPFRTMNTPIDDRYFYGVVENHGVPTRQFAHSGLTPGCPASDAEHDHKERNDLCGGDLV